MNDGSSFISTVLFVFFELLFFDNLGAGVATAGEDAFVTGEGGSSCDTMGTAPSIATAVIAMERG